MSEKGIHVRVGLCPVSDDAELMAPVRERQEFQAMSGMTIREIEPLDFLHAWTVLEPGSVALASDSRRYRVKVLADSGETVVSLADPRHVRLPRSRERLASVRRLYDGMARYFPNSSVEVEDHEPAIVTLHGVDGRSWVLTGRALRSETGARLGPIDVWSFSGEQLASIRLAAAVNPECDQFYSSRDRLVVVRGGKSAHRASLQGMEVAESMLGDDPCTSEDAATTMTLEVWGVPGVE
jgi:hypothetical protein